MVDTFYPPQSPTETKLVITGAIVPAADAAAVIPFVESGDPGVAFAMNRLAQAAANRIAAVVASGGNVSLDVARLLRTSRRTIAGSNVALAHTGDTVEHTFATFTVPGGVLGTDGELIVTGRFTFTNNANAKTPRIYNGTDLICALASPSVAATQLEATYANRNATNSQLLRPRATTTAGSILIAQGALAKDTTLDQVFTLRGLLANSADTITLESWRAEIVQSFT